MDFATMASADNGGFRRGLRRLANPQKARPSMRGDRSPQASAQVPDHQRLQARPQSRSAFLCRFVHNVRCAHLHSCMKPDVQGCACDGCPAGPQAGAVSIRVPKTEASNHLINHDLLANLLAYPCTPAARVFLQTRLQPTRQPPCKSVHTKPYRGVRSFTTHFQILRLHLEPQLRPALAHAQQRDPGRPVFGKEAKHRDRIDAAPLDAAFALALDCEGDAPDRPAHAPIRPHPLLPGCAEAFAQDAPRDWNERIEIERHAVRIQLRADSLLFMPPPENVSQISGEVLGGFARGRASPDHAEVDLLINAVPLRPPIDEARPGRRADKIVQKLVRPRDLKPIEDVLRSLVGPDSNLRRRRLRTGLSRRYARAASTGQWAHNPTFDELLLAVRSVSRA